MNRNLFNLTFGWRAIGTAVTNLVSSWTFSLLKSALEKERWSSVIEVAPMRLTRRDIAIMGMSNRLPDTTGLADPMSVLQSSSLSYSLIKLSLCLTFAPWSFFVISGALSFEMQFGLPEIWPGHPPVYFAPSTEKTASHRYLKFCVKNFNPIWIFF